MATIFVRRYIGCVARTCIESGYEQSSLEYRHGLSHHQETCLVEAFNLRAAIEHTRKNYEMAVEALSDMPPRREQELDPVTLHNQACYCEDGAFRLEMSSRTMLGIAFHTPLPAGCLTTVFPCSIHIVSMLAHHAFGYVSTLVFALSGPFAHGGRRNSGFSQA